MRSLRRIPAAVAISACALSPGLADASSAARQASIASAERPSSSIRRPRAISSAKRISCVAARTRPRSIRASAAAWRNCAATALPAARYAAAARGSSARSKCSAASTRSRDSNHSAARPWRSASPLVQQRFVGAVADQRVAEHELAAVGADEEVLDQEPAVVARVVEQVAQRIGGESLAEDGGGLQRDLVVARQPVHARVDERLDRSGQARLRGLAGIEEELEKKERVALGALDAAGDDRRRHRRRQRRQPARFLGVQRGEIEADQRCAVEHGAPGPGRRVAGEARRHDQQQRLPGGEQGQRGQALERPGVGPVDVLDHQEQRRGRRGRRRQLAHGMQRPLLAGRGAHRRGEGAKRGRRRHVEQVVEEQLAVGGDRPGRGGAFDRRPTLVLLDRAGDAEQAARQAADRVPARFRAEVEHRRGVAGKAERPRMGRELGDEPRLADPGIAADDDDPAALPFGAGRCHRGEVAKLLVPADQRADARRRRCPIAADPVRRERPLLALDLDRRAVRRPRNGRPPVARCRR